jgi:hypothetical protein
MDGAILTLLIGIGGAIFTPVAVAAGKLLSQAVQIQTLKLGNSRWDEVIKIVDASVSSSQQLGKSGQMPLEDKKENATKTAKKLLAGRKIKVEDDILAALIEARVWDNINSPAAQVNSTPVTTTSTSVTSNSSGTSSTTTGTSVTADTPVVPPQDSWVALGLTKPADIKKASDVEKAPVRPAAY